MCKGSYAQHGRRHWHGQHGQRFGAAFWQAPANVIEFDDRYELHLYAPELSRELVVALKRNAFKRTITNLIGNANRFASEIVIRAAKSRKFMIVIVEDNGPGIPEAERENVFRPFYRLDGARNQDSGGNSGLGLAIARDIARSHGGDIELGVSQLGGLQATIRLPL